MMNIIDNGNNNNVTSGVDLSGVNIKFNGNNNYIQFNNCINKNISKVDIEVSGDDALIIFNSVRRIGKLRVLVKDGGIIKVGDKTSIEDAYFLAVEGKKIELGSDCMVSFQVGIRTTDAHGIYDLSTGKLINPPGDIHIGNHVWLAQGVLITANSFVRGNSVIGARSYVRKIDIPENTIAVGAPVKVIKNNITWDRRMTHNIFAEDANIDPFFYDTFNGLED